MQYLMEQAKESLVQVFYNDLEIGKLVLLKTTARWGESMTRAKILEIPLVPGQPIPCLKIDSYSLFEANPKDIFEIPKSIEAIPPFVCA
jgi:hypothetical protein